MAKGNLQAKIGYILHMFRMEYKAFDFYEKAYAKGCTLPDPLAAYGLMLMRRKEYAKAVEVLRHARTLKLNPQQWSIVYQNLGLAYWKLGEIDRAVEIYEKIFEKVQTVNMYSTLGFLLIAQGDQTGDYQKALDFNRKAYDYDDTDASVVDNLGQVLYRTGEIEEAEKMFEKALSIKPTQFDTLYFLSRIRISQDRVEEAKKMLDTALDKTYSVFNTVPRENAIELARSIDMDLSFYDDIPAEN